MVEQLTLRMAVEVAPSTSYLVIVEKSWSHVINPLIWSKSAAGDTAVC